MKGSVKLQAYAVRCREQLPLLVCILAGVSVLLLSGADLSFAQGAYDDSKWGVVCERTFGYLEGGFGALLAAIAGIGAIVASAAGGFRLAWALLVVSLGAYILKEYIGLFFTGGCG